MALSRNEYVPWIWENWITCARARIFDYLLNHLFWQYTSEWVPYLWMAIYETLNVFITCVSNDHARAYNSSLQISAFNILPIASTSWNFPSSPKKSSLLLPSSSKPNSSNNLRVSARAYTRKNWEVRSPRWFPRISENGSRNRTHYGTRCPYILPIRPNVPLSHVTVHTLMYSTLNKDVKLCTAMERDRPGMR